MNIPYVFKKCSKCGEWLVASSVNFNKNKKYKYGLIAECKKCRAKRNKQYRETNKEAIAECGKKYRKANKEHIAEYKRQYRETNKEAIAEYNKKYSKKYRESNKEAISERNRQYRKQNKEAIIEYARQYYETNKEAIAEQQRQYRESNKEAKAEYVRQYRQTPQGQVVAFNSANRRRAKEQAQGRGITKEQWLEMMSFFNWECAYSGKTLTKETRSVDHIEPLNKGGVNEVWNVVPMYRAYNSSKNDKDLLEWYTEQPYFSQDRLNKIYEWQQYAYNKWGTIGAEA